MLAGFPALTMDQRTRKVDFDLAVNTGRVEPPADALAAWP
jgi:hypothetical protein